jgi:hypothetical protein
VVVQGAEILELLRVLATGGVATAAVVQIGQYFREQRSDRDHLDLVKAERDRDIAKIEAANLARLKEIEAERDAEIAKIQANGLVQLQLERERNRALMSSQLGIGPPPG